MAACDDECIQRCRHPEVKIQDAGKSVIFLNPDRADYTRYRVDGCLVKDGLAADFAVEEIDTGLVVVELKGRNVEHALKQVSATTTYFRKQRGYKGRIASLIMSREAPIGSGSMARHRLRYAKEHDGAALQVCSSGKPKHSLRAILNHSGKP